MVQKKKSLLVLLFSSSFPFHSIFLFQSVLLTVMLAGATAWGEFFHCDLAVLERHRPFLLLVEGVDSDRDHQASTEVDPVALGNGFQVGQHCETTRRNEMGWARENEGQPAGRRKKQARRQRVRRSFLYSLIRTGKAAEQKRKRRRRRVQSQAKNSHTHTHTCVPMSSD